MMRRRTTVVLLLASLAGASSAIAGTENEDRSRYVADPGDQASYIRVAGLACGPQHVSIISDCYNPGDSSDVPFCPSQVVDIISKTKKIARTLTYVHPFRAAEPNFVTQLQCAKVGTRDVLVLSSSNFANCSTCEWNDYFYSDGSYIGSSGDPGRDLPVKYRKAESGFEEQIKIISTTGFIDRVIERAKHP